VLGEGTGFGVMTVQRFFVETQLMLSMKAKTQKMRKLGTAKTNMLT
jgi:hypothetical protein